MLILTRKAAEGIRVGESIEIRVISIRPGVVRIGLEAPRSVRILRSELLEPRPAKPGPLASFRRKSDSTSHTKGLSGGPASAPS